MRQTHATRSLASGTTADDAVGLVPGRGATARDARVPGRAGLGALAVPSAALVRAGSELIGGGPADPDAAAAIAASGVANASGRLPHHAQIQAVFGRHELDGIAVARDAAATAASAQLGARAFALGNRIALPAPDLWIEAHEAAHVIQQRTGRVAAHGAPGDAHERHADAVADRVVAGESAAELLDDMVGRGGGPGGEHLQLFRTTSDKIDQRWGYQVAKRGGLNEPSEQKRATDLAYEALRGKLGEYERGASIATSEAVLETAKAFLAAFEATPDGEQGNQKRVTTQANGLIDEAHIELDAQLKRVAQTPNESRTSEQLIDDAVAQLAENPDHRRQRKRLLRYQQEVGIQATAMPEVSIDAGPTIIQNWRARGDMYHVGAVLNLFPQLKVILYDLPKPGPIKDVGQFEQECEHASRWEQACMIADYYGQRDRVYFTRSNGVPSLASKNAAYDFTAKVAQGEPVENMRNLFIDVGGCTTILGRDLLEARQKGGAAYNERKEELARAVAPDPKDGDGRASADEICDYLAHHHWDKSKKYVIVNFRDSGHAYIQKKIAAAREDERERVIENYDPVRDQIGGNHPDLDTGSVGVRQLAELIRARGFTPVFMGEEPDDAAEPHLIRYWTFEHDYRESAAKKLCRGGRAAEAFFIRTVAENYDVRLLSMRSGVTDQLAFLGIPTISIDVDNFHQPAVPELSKVPGYRMDAKDEVAHSWTRGSKLEAGLGRDYGRVFLEESRPLRDFDDRGKWKGTFGTKDLETIGHALEFYFGTSEKEAPESNGVRHRSHPFHPEKMESTERVDESKVLKSSVLGQIDTGLNPETVLVHMRAVLGATPPDVTQAVRFADSQLHFMEGGDSLVRGDRDIKRQTRKLKYRRRFLQDVIAVLDPHGAAGTYHRELEVLDALAQTNAPRRDRMGQAMAALRDSIRFPDLRRDDGQISAYLLRIDAVDLAAIDAKLRLAAAASPVERRDIQEERLAEIDSLLRAAHTAFTEAVADGLQHHVGETEYRRALIAARDQLAKVTWS